MIYAVLFGIADKAIEQIKQVYPNNISQYEEYERNIYAALHCTAFICLAIGTAELYGGGRSGGISSIGGGGGFSGGGFGGGSR